MPHFAKLEKSGKGGRIHLTEALIDHMNISPNDFVAVHRFEGGLLLIQPNPCNAPLPVVTLRPTPADKPQPAVRAITS